LSGLLIWIVCVQFTHGLVLKAEEKLSWSEQIIFLFFWPVALGDFVKEHLRGKGLK